MTRFARAKGSKSSNEKAPADGTPWEVMKEQLLQAKRDNEDTKKREEVEQQRIENYQNFLKEQKTQKRKATWCDFPEAEDNVKRKPVVENSTQGNKVKPSSSAKNIDKIDNNSKKVCENTAMASLSEEVNDVQGEINTSEKKKQKKIKKNKKASENTVISEEDKRDDSQNNMNISIERKEKINKEQDFVKNPIAKNKNKVRGGKATRRKPVDDNSFRLIINGRDVELVRFDGFPIMKKDAERLAELRKEMLRKGIPKSEVQRNMKLERRRAEKALARLKRDVCYNCRKGGHNLSDCPELKSKIPGVDAADGLCFKCGSTEHRQFECKVQRDKEFRFASCFICKEQGHIARQCPDNPKGLYPNGGCCKLCGDVTHLRKDCPTVQDKRVESSVKLQTLTNEDNLEDIPDKAQTATVERASKKPKKIKF